MNEGGGKWKHGEEVMEGEKRMYNKMITTTIFNVYDNAACDYFKPDGHYWIFFLHIIRIIQL